MIIVTGSAGFIGSHIAEFYAKNHRLLLVDIPDYFRTRKTFNPDDSSLWDWATGTENKESRHKIIDRRYFVKVLESIRPETPANDRSAKEKVLLPPGERIEAIIHLGACTNTAETRKDFLEEWNVNYSKSIWNWCAKHKVPLIYASSGATYGNGEAGFSDSWETALKLKPMNPYGQSKQDFDLWVYEQQKLGNVPPSWYGLKFFNVYGECEFHKGPMASPVLHSYRQILRTGECRLFRSHNPACKDGEQSRDFIYVNDIVKLTDFFFKKLPESGLYNCGTGQARTFRSMMEALFQSVQKPMRIQWVDTPEQYRKAYQYFTQADMSRVSALDFTDSFCTLEHGVKQYIDWLQRQDLALVSGGALPN